MSIIACLCPSIVGQPQKNMSIYAGSDHQRFMVDSIQFPPVFPFFLINLKHPNYRSIRQPSSPSSKPTSPSYFPQKTQKSSYNHHKSHSIPTFLQVNHGEASHFCLKTLPSSAWLPRRVGSSGTNGARCSSVLPPCSASCAWLTWSSLSGRPQSTRCVTA